MKTRKFSPQVSGSKVICSGHAHAIVAMHHIIRATPFCKLDKIKHAYTHCIRLRMHICTLFHKYNNIKNAYTHCFICKCIYAILFHMYKIKNIQHCFTSIRLRMYIYTLFNKYKIKNAYIHIVSQV